MADEFSITRDAATGRIVNKRGAAPGAGRPKQSEVERIRAALIEVLDPPTLEAWARSMRKKVARGNVSACEFLFDRVIGRPGVVLNVSTNDNLALFMAAWQRIADDQVDALAGVEPDALTAGDMADDAAQDDDA